MKRMVIRLDDDLHLRLRHLAVDRGVSLQKMMERVVRLFVDAKVSTPSRRNERRR